MVVPHIRPRIISESFPADLAMPQVRIASDGAQMRELLSNHLHPCGERRYHIDDCILTRIRHRRASRCILQYNLHLRDFETGTQRIQWVTGVTYPSNRGKHICKRLRAAGLGEVKAADQTFEPIAFIPELKMLVQLFPYDHRLPALAQMMTSLTPEIESHLLAQFGSEDWRCENWKIEPVRYRAGLAAVLQYTVEALNQSTGLTRTRRFYAKIYRDERGEEIYRILQALWRKNDQVGEHFRVGKPIAYLSGRRVLLQGEASGVSFQEILAAGNEKEALSSARKVARALALLHLSDVNTTRKHLREDEISVLKTRGKTLEWSTPKLKEEIDTIVKAVINSLEEVPLRPTHLDFKTDHILFDLDRYSLLDFDSFALSDPVLDVAHALAQIFGIKFRFEVSRDLLKRTADAFTEEYFTHVPGDWRRRLPPYYAGAALKVAVGFFRRQEPQWRDTVAALIAEAKASMGG